MAKSLKDILAGVKSSKIVPGSTGSDPGVDYAPKAPNEQEFVKKHSTEKHADRVGNGDDIYQATNIKHVMASPKEAKHGHKKPNDKNVYESKKVGDEVEVSSSKTNPDFKSKATVKFVGKGFSIAKDKSGKQYTVKEAKEKCNMTEAGTACPVHEMADCTKKSLREVAKNPYAIGMAAAMKQTGDKPPLKKSTITKAHDIAKSVAKEEVEAVDEAIKPYVSYSGPRPGKSASATVMAAGEKPHKTFTKDEHGHDYKEKAVNYFKKNMKKLQSESLQEVKHVFHVHMPADDNRDHKMVDDRTSEPVGNKPKGHKLKITVPATSRTEATNKAAKYVAKNYGTNVKFTYSHKIDESLAVPLIGSNDEDESAEMAKTQLRALANKALHLAMQLSDDQVVEPWVQSKIAVAKEQVTAVHDYMIYGEQKEKEEQTAPYDGSVDMSGAPRNTLPSFSADVNTGRVV
jgi:hypothetical protein